MRYLATPIADFVKGQHLQVVIPNMKMSAGVNPISHGRGDLRTPSNFAAFGDPLTVKYIGMFYAENS